MWTIFRTSAAAGSSSFGDLKPSWINNNNSILCGGAGRGTSADRGRHSNRKPSCNDRSQTPDHAAAARAGRKTLEKVFVLILRFLARKGDLVRVQNACKCEKRTSEPHNFVRVGHCIRFFACSTVISTLHRKISKNTKKCKSAVFKCFRAEKKKMVFIQKSLERRRSGEHGQSVCAFGSRSSTTQRPRGRRGHQLARQGSGRREDARDLPPVRYAAPRFLRLRETDGVPREKNQETERAFEALLQMDGP